ncbi:MAG: DUF47 family protein [Verrucomicrobiota bacterium]
MFSLQTLFGKGDKFFDLLEASAEESRASVQSLVKILSNPAGESPLDELVLTRRKEKRIAEEISEQLVQTFVTGLEREDIEALSHALYKIPKTVEKFAERYLLSFQRVRGVDFTKQALMAEKSTDTLLAMVRLLRTTPSLEKIKELNDKLQYFEGEADKVMVELLRDLYSGRHDPVTAIAAKDLYELLERTIDRCRDAGNVVNHIVLKNS